MFDRSPISVVIVDDSELVVQGLRTMLAPFPLRVNVLSSSIGSIPPVTADVLLVDAFGHPEAGIDRVSKGVARGTFDHVALIAWRLSAERRVKAFEAGASAVLSKSAPANRIVEGIEAVVNGERIEQDFPDHVWRDVSVAGHGSALNPREAELLALTANGLTNTEVGAIMYIAPSTVKTYLKRVYKKIGVNNRAQATLRAVQLGLVGPDAEF